MINLSDTILSTDSDVRAVKYTVHIVKGHKGKSSIRQLDKAKYLSNKMSGARVTVFQSTPFYS